MTALLAPLLGGVGVVIAAAAGPLVTGTIQNRRDARLTADLERNWELLKELKAEQENPWTHEVAQLEVLVRSQLAAVMARQTRFVAHRRNWASLGAVTMIVVLAFPLLWLLAVVGAWWAWTLFVALLLLALILCGIGLYQTFNPVEPPAPEDEPGSSS
ncbi:hypothetical protein OG756_12900 [Streptomyces sp. NBC_01310]|uniref:hypothetical protein n=1 Tax=Streptomyces sp. NBC_01310 TaxID=2903820 RepID=UPI0035B5C535|nr:hypothetical protein OG756_12900 [Streptomyces sp. NBC_01310]